MSAVVSVRSVSKSFRIPSIRRDTVREHVFGLFEHRRFDHLQVLDDVSFDLMPGETLGIMGRNGSGKSTLLKIVCGIYPPDTGAVRVRAPITPILELGAGWNPELDAVDNVFLVGSVMGLSLGQIRSKLDAILAFAEVERFANLELKHYSSGMASRLAYAIAFESVRDVLVLDEVFAVGDAGFRTKCETRYRELRAGGHSVLLVSHDPAAVEAHCDRAVLLDQGRITLEGPGAVVGDRYERLVGGDTDPGGAVAAHQVPRSAATLRSTDCRADADPGDGRDAGGDVIPRDVRQPEANRLSPEQPFPWLEVVRESVRRWPTPFYVAAWQPVQAALDELAPLRTLRPTVRHWLSVKTQPARPLLRSWREALGFGVEVVSEFELRAALETGFAAGDILVNGLAKHRWLPRDLTGLRVHLDSLTEAREFGPDALRQYRIGARLRIAGAQDEADPTVGGQFGLTESELGELVSLLGGHELPLEGVHFHLRSNIRDPEIYASAVAQALSMAAAAGATPRYVDCGGGLPARGEALWENGTLVDRAMSIPGLVASLGAVLDAHPSVCEVWFENGRFLTSQSAVLVLQVLDVKERRDCRYLLCDGGRTNHALPSDWEEHAVATLPSRGGPDVLTAVCGPTCTAYDRLVRRPLPATIVPGDHLVWFNAGAYHLSWETRFSHGLAPVIWCDEHMRLSSARRGEDFRAWWERWT